jgi:hypothetical protein
MLTVRAMEGRIPVVGAARGHLEVPVRPVPVVEMSQKETASGVTLAPDRLHNSLGKPGVLVCYEPPADEHSWFTQCGNSTSLKTIPRRSSTIVRLFALWRVARMLLGAGAERGCVTRGTGRRKG